MTTEESLKKTYRYNYQCGKCKYYRRLGGSFGIGIGFVNCCHYMLDTNERKRVEPETGLCFSYTPKGAYEYEEVRQDREPIV